MTTIQHAPQPAHELHNPSHHAAASPPKLRSNQGDYVDPASIGWLRPTPADTPVEELRARFEEDGYIFVKGLIPREDVLDMREHYFSQLAHTGILAPGTSPRDGIFDMSADPLEHRGVGGTDLPEDKEKVAALARAHKTDVYQAFLRHPQFRQFIRQFMGWEKETMVMRNMLRHNVPNGLSTGVHYDRIFLRAGTPAFLTAWVPIGDCSASGGGLTYLARSNSLGLALEAEYSSRADAAGFTQQQREDGFNMHMAKDGQLGHDVEELGRRLFPQGGGEWLVADYEAGDVVFHTPWMVHGAGRNEDESGRIRLSSDVRFYEEGAKVDERWCRGYWAPDDGL